MDDDEDDYDYPVVNDMEYVLSECDRRFKEITDRIDAENAEMHRENLAMEMDPVRVQKRDQVLRELDMESERLRMERSRMMEMRELEHSSDGSEGDVYLADIAEVNAQEQAARRKRLADLRNVAKKPVQETTSEMRNRIQDTNQKKENKKAIQQGKRMQKEGKMRPIQTYFK